MDLVFQMLKLARKSVALEDEVQILKRRVHHQEQVLQSTQRRYAESRPSRREASDHRSVVSNLVQVGRKKGKLPAKRKPGYSLINPGSRRKKRPRGPKIIHSDEDEDSD